MSSDHRHRPPHGPVLTGPRSSSADLDQLARGLPELTSGANVARRRALSACILAALAGSGWSEDTSPAIALAVPPLSSTDGSGIDLPLVVDSAAGSGEKRPPKPYELALAPIPKISPDLGAGVTLLGLLTITPKDPASRPITIGLAGFYTDNGSWVAGAGVKFQSFEDRLRTSVVGGYGSINETYEFDAPTPGEHSLDLNTKTAFAMVQSLVRVAPALYLGPRVQYRDLQLSPENRPSLGADLEAEADAHVRGPTLAAVLQYDDRDSQFYPTRGWLINAVASESFMETTATVSTGIGSASVTRSLRYETALANCNHYNLLFGGVLALRVATKWTSDDTPFYDLAQIGVLQDMRGYASGVHFDHTLAAAQSEYRHELGFWRLGGAVFAGVAKVAPSYDELLEAPTYPAFGVGLRWTAAVQNHINLRLDVAQGHDGSTVYMTLGEAF